MYSLEEHFQRILGHICHLRTLELTMLHFNIRRKLLTLLSKKWFQGSLRLIVSLYIKLKSSFWPEGPRAPSQGMVAKRKQNNVENPKFTSNPRVWWFIRRWTPSMRDGYEKGKISPGKWCILLSKPSFLELLIRETKQSMSVKFKFNMRWGVRVGRIKFKVKFILQRHGGGDCQMGKWFKIAHINANT